MHKGRILLQQGQCLVLQPELVKLIGKSPAIVLQQIHYWLSSDDDLGKVVDEIRYVHNTLEQWVESIKSFSLSTIKRAIAILKKFNLIIIKKLNSKFGNRTNWYAINYDNLSAMLGEGSTDHQQSGETLANNQLNKLKMNQSSDQNEPIYIETKTTNRDTLNNHNKSENRLAQSFKEEYIPQKMLSIWNDKLNPEIQPVLNQTRARMLAAAFKLKFNNDLNQWKAYCEQIASSDYLMDRINSGFKVNLEWALKFDTIQRVMELQFGVKPIVNVEKIEEDVAKSLNGYSHKEKELRSHLVNKLGASTYKSWFEESQIILTDTVLEIITKSKFSRDWISSNFSNNLEKIFLKNVVIS